MLDDVPTSALGTFQKDLGRPRHQPAGGDLPVLHDPAEARRTSAGPEGQLRRQAISYAIDRPTITKAIFKGTRTPAKDFTSPVIAGFSAASPATRS